MPQVAAHLLIADKIAQSIGDPSFISSNRSVYHLGAVGPDLSFFIFDAAPMRSFLLEVIGVLATIDDAVQLFKSVSDKVGGPPADLADWITGGLSTDVGALFGSGLTALKNAIGMQLLPSSTVTVTNPFAGSGFPNAPSGPNFSVTASDLSPIFRAFGHPYSVDKPYRIAEPPGVYDNWWWMDVLHYRRTGPFARRLLQNASNDLERAYAHGYVTHVAADVVGHPYVNAVVGGPFRLHVIRHLVLEKIIDTWVHQHYTGQDIITAELHKAVDVGTNISTIAALLNRTIREVYTAPTSGVPSIITALNGVRGMPTDADWKGAYDIFIRYLKLSTSTGIAPPTPPPGSPAELFAEIGSSLANSASGITQSFSSSNSWWEWLLAPFLAAAYALNLLFKLATLPAGVLARVAALAPRWFIYFLLKALHDYIIETRWVLALGGFGTPSSTDLSRPLAQTAALVPPSRSGGAQFHFPLVEVPRNQQAFWLADPSTLNVAREDPVRRLECSPYPTGAAPDVFIDGPTYDDPQDGLLQTFAGPLGDPDETLELELTTRHGPQLGNAVEFGKRLLTGVYPLGSFDLDGDRGYGFLSWEGPPTMKAPQYQTSVDQLTDR